MADKYIQYADSISDDRIFECLQHFGLEPKDHGNYFTAITGCHGGDSMKLYFYKDNRLFRCYTNCGNMDIFGLFKHLYNCSAKEAAHHVFSYFGGMDDDVEPIVENPMKILRQRLKKNAVNVLKPLDEAVLDDYYDMAYKPWIDEGISVQTMKKFDIKYDVLNDAVIIPHRDINGRLVGVRQRNLRLDIVEAGMKYIPTTDKTGKTLSYPTGDNLYGLCYTKKAINKTHKIILFEAEKSVLLMQSYIGDNNISVGLNGDKLSDGQFNLIKQLDVDEVIVALDKEYRQSLTRKEFIYAQKVQSKFEKLINRYKISVLWDTKGLLGYKDSPIDCGYDTFQKLMAERIYL